MYIITLTHDSHFVVHMIKLRHHAVNATWFYFTSFSRTVTARITMNTNEMEDPVMVDVLIIQDLATYSRLCNHFRPIWHYRRAGPLVLLNGLPECKWSRAILPAFQKMRKQEIYYYNLKDTNP